MSGKHVGIDLLRHGDTGQRSYRGQLDDPLSTLGWSQLRAAIFGRSWDAIVTSPLRRCAEFAHARFKISHPRHTCVGAFGVSGANFRQG